MQRLVTAIYRSYSVAELVREELVGLGIDRGHVTVLPDQAATTPAASGSEDDPAFDRLHDLNLPDDDVKTYQQAIRNGDYILSVNVDDEGHLPRVRDVMRRPEDARNLGELDRVYAASRVAARRDAAQETNDERQIGRREAAQESPYTRSYDREQPLRPRDRS